MVQLEGMAQKLAIPRSYTRASIAGLPVLMFSSSIRRYDGFLRFPDCPLPHPVPTPTHPPPLILLSEISLPLSFYLCFLSLSPMPLSCSVFIVCLAGGLSGCSVVESESELGLASYI